jgi:bleomycin hydrolase
MLVNLVTRYGVMPKKCFPDSYSSESSLRMNSILKSKVFGLNKYCFFTVQETMFFPV